MTSEQRSVSVSVLIPAYNSSRVIRATIDSVLQQTAPPVEILVMDDGSTDDTVPMLRSCYPSVTVFQQKNRGVAVARHELCERSAGELVAFLDHDDIWHPKYLETQCRNFRRYPEAAAFFAGHVNFYGYGPFSWSLISPNDEGSAEVFAPLNFIRALQNMSGNFGSASFFCIAKKVLVDLSREPFSIKVGEGDDRYLSMALALVGPVVYCASALVAYRVIPEAQSTNEVRSAGQGVEFFELLEERYKRLADPSLLRAFEVAFAGKRRYYAKRLLSAGKTAEARNQIVRSLNNSRHSKSVVKSLGLLSLTYMPRSMQPSWPPTTREWRGPEIP
jgi:glycosyltransferase involved in cell wall biosynthesis